MTDPNQMSQTSSIGTSSCDDSTVAIDVEDGRTGGDDADQGVAFSFFHLAGLLLLVALVVVGFVGYCVWGEKSSAGNGPHQNGRLARGGAHHGGFSSQKSKNSDRYARSGIFNTNGTDSDGNSIGNSGTTSNTKRAGQISMGIGGAGMVVGALGMGASKILIQGDGGSSEKQVPEAEAPDSSIVGESSEKKVPEAEAPDSSTAGESSDEKKVPEGDDAPDSSIGKDASEESKTTAGSLLRKASSGNNGGAEDWTGEQLTLDNWDSVMAGEKDNAWVIFVHSGLEDARAAPSVKMLVEHYKDHENVKVGVYDMEAAGGPNAMERLRPLQGTFKSHYQFLAPGTQKEKDYNDGTEYAKSTGQVDPILSDEQKSRIHTLEDSYTFGQKAEQVAQNFDKLTLAIDEQVTPGSRWSSSVSDGSSPISTGGATENTTSSTGGDVVHAMTDGEVESNKGSQNQLFLAFLVVFVLSLVLFLVGLVLICADRR